MSRSLWTYPVHNNHAGKTSTENSVSLHFTGQGSVSRHGGGPSDSNTKIEGVTGTRMCVRGCIRVYVRACVGTYVRGYSDTHKCVYVGTYVCVWVRMYVGIQISVIVCVRGDVRVCGGAYVRGYTDTHKCVCVSEYARTNPGTQLKVWRSRLGSFRRSFSVVPTETRSYQVLEPSPPLGSITTNPLPVLVRPTERVPESHSLVELLRQSSLCFSSSRSGEE